MAVFYGRLTFCLRAKSAHGQRFLVDGLNQLGSQAVRSLPVIVPLAGSWRDHHQTNFASGNENPAKEKSYRDRRNRFSSPPRGDHSSNQL